MKKASLLVNLVTATMVTLFSGCGEFYPDQIGIPDPVKGNYTFKITRIDKNNNEIHETIHAYHVLIGTASRIEVKDDDTGKTKNYISEFPSNLNFVEINGKRNKLKDLSNSARKLATRQYLFYNNQVSLYKENQELKSLE